MTDSKWLWRLGGAALTFIGVAAGGVYVARTPYQLKVSVVDAQGAIPGAWVSFKDRDVVLTDAQGQVVFKGRRYALDTAIISVTDPGLNPPHLSQTMRADVSWLPWVRETHVRLTLPIIASVPESALAVDASVPVAEGSASGSAIDLPHDLSAPGHDLTQLNEEELTDSLMAAALGFAPSQWTAVWDNLEKGSTLGWACVLSGLSTGFCRDAAFTEKIPLLSALRSAAEGQSGALDKTAVPALREVELLSSKNESSGEKSEHKSPKERSELSTGLSVDKPVRIETILDGQVLQGSLVFMSRLKDQRVRELGETRVDGSLTVKIPPEFWGETITVFHDCCAPRTFPAKVTRVAGESKLRLEMQKGSGVGVTVQQEAYGYFRKVPQFEVLSNLGKIAISGQDGFALYNSTKTPEQVPTKVVVRGARPAEFFVRSDDLPGLQTRPLNFLVAPEEPFLPALAVIEKNDGRAFEGVLKSSGLRRWRRDFMARLMQQSTIKTIVSAEAQARIAAAGESTTDVIARGWQQTQLAGEWDFVLSIEYNDAQQSVRVAASTPDGRSFFEKEENFAKGGAQLPERVSRLFYQDFLELFPFEAHVLRQDGDSLELSFSGGAAFGLRDDSPLALWQQSANAGELKLSELAALAVVVPSEDGQRVKARITHWNSKARKTRVLPDVVRAVKVNPEFYKKEAARNAMAKAGTRGSGKAL